jgi:hypothetical protein
MHSRSQSPIRSESKTKSRERLGTKERPATSPDQQKEELSQQLKSISQRLAKIQVEKRKLSPLYRPTTPNTNKQETKKEKRKREFFHPKLEFVMAEAAYSPYLTPPTANYGQKTLHYPSKMKEIRFQGRDPIPEEGFPVDVEFARRRFVKEIIQFKPRFEVQLLPIFSLASYSLSLSLPLLSLSSPSIQFHEEKTNLPAQYLAPLPDLYIPNVHAKPRRESMVYPNNYQPLKDHRGKLPVHLRAYLDYDPRYPDTAPKTKITEAEAKELIKELTDARSSSPIRRLGSGSYQAHGARGGPNKYREEIQYRNAVKQFVRMLSNASGGGETTPSPSWSRDASCDDEDNVFGLEELTGGAGGDHLRKDHHYDPSLETVMEPTDAVMAADSAPDVAPTYTPASPEEDKRPPFVFEMATLQIKQITIKNLQSKLVYGTKQVYATLKSGKIYSCQTTEILNPPNPIKWTTSPGDHSLSLPVSSTAINNYKIKFSVFNKSKGKKNRSDVSYGSHTLTLTEELQRVRFDKEFVSSFEIKTSDGERGGKVSLVMELLEGNISEGNEPDRESKVDQDDEHLRVEKKEKEQSSERQEEGNVGTEAQKNVDSKSSSDHPELNDDYDEYNDEEEADAEATTSQKPSQPSVTDEDHVPISVDNFFDALSSTENSVVHYFDDAPNDAEVKETKMDQKETDDYDDDQLYDDFDDEDDQQEDAEEQTKQTSPRNPPPMLGRQMTMFESIDNWEEEGNPNENANATPTAAPLADENSATEYGGEDFDNESETKATPTAAPLVDENSATEYGAEDFDNESETKATPTAAPLADENSATEYGGEDFDNESETKATPELEYDGDDFED